MNLITESQKELLKIGLKRRFYIVALCLMSAMFVSATVMLIPPYVMTMGQAENLLIHNTESADEKSVKDLLDLPRQIEARLKLYQNNLSQGYTSSYITKTISNMPQGISLESISFSREQLYKEKRGTLLTVAGTASDREALVVFSNKLKDAEIFSLVDVPISNLAKGKDLPFTINLFIAK